MPIQPVGGYDPGTGWPPDDSTGQSWDDNVDIPGQFGRGGFRPRTALDIPPNTPPRGLTLSGPNGGAAAGGPDVFSPTSQPLRPGVSPTVRTGPGPATEVTPNGGGGGFFDGLGRWVSSALPFLGPAAVPALAVGGAAAGAYAEPRTPRVDPRISAAGSGGFDVEQPLGPPQGPLGQGPYANAPSGPQNMGPGTGQGPFAGRPVYGGDPRNEPPNEITGPAYGPPPPSTPPASIVNAPLPPRRPRPAGGQVAKQQPNLGAYTGPPPGMIYRPNAPAGGNARGGGGSPYMGDPSIAWQRLFGNRGQQ